MPFLFGSREFPSSFRTLTTCLGLSLLTSACASWAAAKYHGPKIDHVDGKHFHNPGGQAVDDSIAEAIKRELQRPEGRANWKKWEDGKLDVPPRRVGHGQVRVSFVNHATV